MGIERVETILISTISSHPRICPKSSLGVLKFRLLGGMGITLLNFGLLTRVSLAWCLPASDPRRFAHDKLLGVLFPLQRRSLSSSQETLNASVCCASRHCQFFGVFRFHVCARPLKHSSHRFSRTAPGATPGT